VHAEFETKEKEREVQARIQKSTELGNSRVQKMKYRDDLLNQLLKDATARAAVISAQPNYPSLLTRLIVQALIKIEETDVVIYCRQADLAMVTKVLPQAVSDLVKLMKEKAGVDVKPNVTARRTLRPRRGGASSRSRMTGGSCATTPSRHALTSSISSSYHPSGPYSSPRGSKHRTSWEV
jgi:vacuolar-type H+-ATPase subunit E/Vma4